MTSVFIRRPGCATVQIRVFEKRPRVCAAARAMRRNGHGLPFISWSLGMSRDRLDRLIDTFARMK